MYSTVFESRA